MDSLDSSGMEKAEECDSPRTESATIDNIDKQVEENVVSLSSSDALSTDISFALQTDQVFRSRDELMDWAKDICLKHGTIIIILKYDGPNSRRTPRLLLGCERSLKSKEPKKRISTKKTDCPFRLRGTHVMIDGVVGWKLSVVCGSHNHKAFEFGKRFSTSGKLKPEEKLIVRDMSEVGLKPSAILKSIKEKDPTNRSTIRTIYNARRQFQSCEEQSQSLDPKSTSLSDPPSTTRKRGRPKGVFSKQGSLMGGDRFCSASSFVEDSREQPSANASLSPPHLQGAVPGDDGLGSAPSFVEDLREQHSVYPTVSPSHLQGLFGSSVGGNGYRVAMSSVENSREEPLYWKALNPTLSPSHLRDLPGFTRSVYKNDHALITPESHVFSPVPDWTNTLGAYLITPDMGSHFTMFLAKMQENSKSALPPENVERFIFVIQGSVVLLIGSETKEIMLVDSYAYLPSKLSHSLECDSTATLVVFERRYISLDNQTPERFVGSTSTRPLIKIPGEDFKLRKLLPTSALYDFNIHVMDFQPGEYVNVKEVHYNQHGLILLEGQGIYRLGDNWYPVQAGDVMWMAPFVPQWYAALGKTRTRYLLYHDVKRNSL